MNGATLTHFNFPIPTSLESEFLTSGRLSVTASLTANSPSVPGDPIELSIVFDFLFIETPNVSDCGFSSESSCDDLFTLVNAGARIQDFTFSGENYELEFGSDELAALDAETCALVGLDAGCNGFLTTEEGITNFSTFIARIC